MSATGSVLLDTNVVIAHFREDTDLTSRFLSADSLFLPWIALGELYYGARRAKRGQAQFALIGDFLSIAMVLLPDSATTEQYGELKDELATAGKLIPDNDIWIAALAVQYDLPLATRDAHFAAVSRLKTLPW